LSVSTLTILTGVILSIVIALIIITLSAFLLVALYKVCHKKTAGIWLIFSEQREEENISELVIKMSLEASEITVTRDAAVVL
ncbi:hypothetical protein CIB84_011001, partial [Bambusicola thoracicus]